MVDEKNKFSLTSDVLRLEARRISWDSELLGYPVGEIILLELEGGADSQCEFARFNSWVKDGDYGMISCRLPHQKLYESQLLERNDFRFIEMVLHPTIMNLQDIHIENQGLVVSSIDAVDIPLIGEIAAKAFSYERFHVDPYLNSDFGNSRYKRWVENSQSSDTQQLLKATLDGKIIGFFLVEYRKDLVYWHLTAMSPEYQGRGLGVRVWAAMMIRHQRDGFNQILTTISARNVPVLNLYSKLNFRFMPPEMTFHWTKQEESSHARPSSGQGGK